MHRLGDNARARALIDPLFENPHLDAGRVKHLLGVSDPTARKVVGGDPQPAIRAELTWR